MPTEGQGRNRGFICDGSSAGTIAWPDRIDESTQENSGLKVNTWELHLECVFHLEGADSGLCLCRRIRS